MALTWQQIGKCKRCNKYSMMWFTNHKQSQDYCALCQPIVEQEELHNAVRLMIHRGITPDIYTEFFKEKAGPKVSEQDPKGVEAVLLFRAEDFEITHGNETFDSRGSHRHASSFEAAVLANKKVKSIIAELTEARREIEILRLYGNKDCTAMADEQLELDRGLT